MKPRQIHPHAGSTVKSPEPIPAGWPRPFYLKEGDNRHMYVQYITSLAEEQIFACDSNRTTECYEDFKCTSCAEPLTEGAILDLEEVSKQHVAAGLKPCFRDYDNPIAGAMCPRCAVFAAKVCPWFSGIVKKTGQDLVWVRVLSKSDYEYFDEDCGTVQLSAGGKRRKRFTTTQLRERIAL